MEIPRPIALFFRAIWNLAGLAFLGAGLFFTGGFFLVLLMAGVSVGLGLLLWLFYPPFRHWQARQWQPTGYDRPISQAELEAQPPMHGIRKSEDGSWEKF